MKLKNIMNKVFEIKLVYRLIIIYLLCGVVPMLLTEVYLLRSISNMLIQQEKKAVVDEMTAMKKQLTEILNTTVSVSRYFYFDEELEKIAEKNYENYQENVNDLRNYSSFIDFGSYHSNIIQRISIFMDNDSLKGNAHFLKVDEETTSAEWYQEVLKKKGAIVWCMQTGGLPQDEYFALTRLLSTKNHEPVGVLTITLRNSIFQEMVNERAENVIILLDGEIPLYTSGKDINLLEWKDYIPIQEEIVSKNIRSQGEEYVLTGMSIALPESNNQIQIISILSYRDVLKEVKGKRQGSILICFIGMASAGILIWLYSKSYGTKVEHFRMQMQKAAQGNFDLEHKVSGNDEISELYGHLNTMIFSIQKLLADIYREQLQKERFKTKQKDAEFKMLASQINPHFLYNTLETIRMEARAHKEYDIEELIKMLSGILRYNLRIGNEPVTINSEIALLKDYLKIQQYRFGERIQYSIFVEPILEEQCIIPLILQPIIENAIVHGLETKEGTGHVWIDVRLHKNNIEIDIEDDGAGIEQEQLRQLHVLMEKEDHVDTTHIGVSNVHQRLKLYYGQDYGLKIESIKGSGTKVKICIPYGLEE